MGYKFEIHKDKRGQYRARFKYNSETIFSTEAYTTKASAQKAIRSVKEKGPTAGTDDLTVKTLEPSLASKVTAVAQTVARKPKAAAKAAIEAVEAVVEKAKPTRRAKA